MANSKFSTVKLENPETPSQPWMVVETNKFKYSDDENYQHSFYFASRKAAREWINQVKNADEFDALESKNNAPDETPKAIYTLTDHNEQIKVATAIEGKPEHFELFENKNAALAEISRIEGVDILKFVDRIIDNSKTIIDRLNEEEAAAEAETTDEKPAPVDGVMAEEIEPNNLTKAFKTLENLEPGKTYKAGPSNQVALSNISQTSDASCVAIVYPESPNYDLSETAIAELDKKYSHLRQLDVDDKKGYKELTTAITAVKKVRTENQAQENAIKEPLNAFRAKVLSIGQGLRKQVSMVEDILRAEQKRIDDIREEREAAQKMLWAKNLGTVQALSVIASGTLIQLKERVINIENFDLDCLDFGDLLEDAKAALANAHIQVKQQLSNLTRQIEMEAEQARRDKEAAEEKEARRLRDIEQAEKDKKQAEADKARSEADAAKDKELEEMRATMAKMQAELLAKNEPKAADIDTKPANDEPETTNNDQKSCFDESPEPTVEEKAPEIDGSMVHTGRQADRQYSTHSTDRPARKEVAFQDKPVEPEEKEKLDDGQNDTDVISQADIDGVVKFKNKLSKMVEDAEGHEWQSELVYTQIHKVTSNLEKMGVFLESLQQQSEATQ